jgi:short-subunit dehydrogenase
LYKDAIASEDYHCRVRKPADVLSRIIYNVKKTKDNGVLQNHVTRPPSYTGNSLDIPGKVVLIIGASRGIGAACADSFSRRSALLSLTARTPFDSRDGSLVITGDVTNGVDRAHIVEATLERFGCIDILVNNAGQGSYEPALVTDNDHARALFELNFFGPLALMQLVVPHMRRQGGGMIVNVGSIAGQVALPWMSIYSSTKFALGALTNALRIELRSDRIGMMNVCPGYVDTPFHNNAIGTPPPRISGAKPFAISPRRCAEAIARGVERDARTVVTPGIGWLMLWLERICPSVVDSRLSSLSK